MQKVKVKDHLVQKLEWKQTDGQTDGRRRLHSLPCSRLRYALFREYSIRRIWIPHFMDARV